MLENQGKVMSSGCGCRGDGYGRDRVFEAGGGLT